MVHCLAAIAGGKEETGISKMLSPEGTILANVDEICCNHPSLLYI